MNLLQNAIDAVEPCNQKEITITADPQEKFLEIIITDTGTGISGDHLDKIFDPFFTTKEVGKGTGLGLSIAKKIIEDCAGDIFLNSEPDEGTSVHVKLPVINTHKHDHEKKNIGDR